MKTAQAVATGTLVSHGCELFGVYVRAAGTAGTLVLRDDGAGGTVLMTVNTPAAVGAHFIPTDDGLGHGIIFDTDLHATLTTADAVTVVYK